MSIRRPGLNKKIGGHRYTLWKDNPTGRREAEDKATILRRQYISVRLVELRTGWVIYVW